MEDEVAWVWLLGMLAVARFEVEKFRRAPSLPARLTDEELPRWEASVDFAMAEIEDMAGGALAECDGLRMRFAISLASR